MNTTRSKLKKVPNTVGLYRHESGTYYGNLKIKGKIKSASLKTADRKTAERILREWADEERSRSEDATMDAVCVRFLRTKAGLKPGTIKNYEWIVGALKKNFPLFNSPIHKVKPGDLAAYFAGLKLMPRSHNEVIEAVTQIFELAVNDGNIAKNPVKQLNRIRKKVIKKKINVPTFEEFEKIVENIRSQPQADTRELTANFVSFYGRAGVGEAEARKLDWKDIDFKAERISFQRVKTGTYFHVPF